MNAWHCPGAFLSSGDAFAQSAMSPSLFWTFFSLLEAPLAPAPNICAAVFTWPFVPVSMTNAPTMAPFTKCVAPSQSPLSSSAWTFAHGRLDLADHDHRDVERGAARHLCADAARDADAAERKVRLHLVGVVQLHDRLLLAHAEEAVLAVDLAVLQELEALAAVRDDRDVLLHEELEVAALLRLPVDDERLTAVVGLAARAFADALRGRRFLRTNGGAGASCSAAVERGERGKPNPRARNETTRHTSIRLKPSGHKPSPRS